VVRPLPAVEVLLARLAARVRLQPVQRREPAPHLLPQAAEAGSADKAGAVEVPQVRRSQMVGGAATMCLPFPRAEWCT